MSSDTRAKRVHLIPRDISIVSILASLLIMRTAPIRTSRPKRRIYISLTFMHVYGLG